MLSRKTKFALVVLMAVFIVIYAVAKASTAKGEYDAFAKCLTEKGVKFAGAYWCGHCASQKKLFGKSIKYVDYVECDPKGSNANPEFCKNNAVKYYPTWIFPGGTKYEGEASLEKLSELSGCELIKDTKNG